MEHTAKIRWLGRKTVYGKWSSNKYNLNKLYYVRSGSCRVTVGREEIALCKGMLYLIPAGSDLSPESDTVSPLDHSYADFELIPPLSGNGLYMLDPNDDNLTRAAADVLISLTNGENESFYFSELEKETSALLSAALLYLINKFIRTGGIPEAKYDDIAMAMLNDLSESLESELTVEILAKKYFMTPESVIRKFKRAFNVTPMAYLRRLRISTASYLLGTGMKLSEVARRVGYADPSSLLHAMKRSERQERIKK